MKVAEAHEGGRRKGRWAGDWSLANGSFGGPANDGAHVQVMQNRYILGYLEKLLCVCDFC